MKINGRPLTVKFSRRPPRIVAHRTQLGLPALWPGYIMGVTRAHQRVKFEIDSVIEYKYEDIGRRYVHPNYELLVFYDPTENVPSKATFTRI